MKIYERVIVEISEGAVNFDSCGGDESGGEENRSRGIDVSVPPITTLTLATTPLIANHHSPRQIITLQYAYLHDTHTYLQYQIQQQL